MYARFNVLRHLVRNLSVSKSYSQLIRFQSSTSSYVTNNSRTNEDVFLDLTTDYNRKRFVRSEILTNAIQNISENISERLSLLILTAAARCVHHITPEKRVELLEEAWKTLNDKKVRLTARHYETYLGGLNENGFIFDADHYLKLIDNEQIQATPRLYSLLLTQYCREGNTDRAQNFLKMLKERNISIDEDIFAALIVCQLKLGNDKGANDIIQLMKERGLQPTISTYKEILTALISEHKLEQFEYYFGQIESQQRQTSSSTVYIDAHFAVILLGQCISYKERPIFDLLLNTFKELDHRHMPNNLFNLAVQCVTNGWHDAAIELLEIQSKIEFSNDDESPYQGIHGRQWVSFFRQLFENKNFDLIHTYLTLMVKKNLVPLDSILRVLYTTSIDDYRLALDYLEHGQKLKHSMRANYFYPLLVHTYSNETSQNWSNDERLRLFQLLNQLTTPIESSAYARLFQKSFHQFYENNFQKFFQQLADNKLQTISDRFARLLIIDVQQKSLPLNTIEQIASYFLLNTRTRQEELARYIYQIVAKQQQQQSNENPTDLSSIYELINQISTNLSNEVPQLKNEIYTHLLRLSAQNHRKDLTSQLADQCIKESIKIGGSMNEIDLLTAYALPRNIVEQLARYKPGELSWKERLASIDLQRANRSKLEEIYQEAKQDGKHPTDLQKRLLDLYVQKKSVRRAFTLLHEIYSNKQKIEPSTLHRLFNLITVKIDDTTTTVEANYYEDLKFLSEIYDRSYNIINLPTELTFRLAHMHLLHGDQENALKLISNKINSKFDDEVYHYLIKFLQIDSSLLTVDGLTSIGNLLLNFRTSEPIRKFWNLFFDILLQKSSPQDLVQYYSETMRENSNIPYIHLFELFIQSEELNRLQDIVDIATLQHGPHNVLHDLGMTLIQGGKIKQAEKIFQTPWLKARNDRINLHALMLADKNNLDGLITAIKLTKNLPDINQKQLYNSAIRVAIRLDKSDVVSTLVKEIEENQIKLDARMKKYLDAHLLSKGLDPVKISLEEKPVEERRTMSAQN